MENHPEFHHCLTG